MNLNDFKQIKINDLTVIQLNIGGNIIWKKEEPQPTEKWYIGTCLGNYVDTDVVGDDISKIEAEFYYPEEYLDLEKSAVAYFGSRNAGGDTQELSLKVNDSNSGYVIRLSDNKIDVSFNTSRYKEEKKYGYFKAIIDGWDSKLYGEDGYEYNFVTYPNNSGSNQIPLVLFDIANATTKTSQKKSTVAYIHSVKIYDNNAELIRDYESQIIDNIPVIVNKLDNTIAPIIGDNLIYYFTDYSDVHIYDPKQPTSTYDYQVATTLSELSTDDNIKYAYTYGNSKWNALNTDNQYEQWGIIEETNDINSISKYDGKLAILNGDTKYEYQYSNNQWNNVGEVTGGFGLIGQIDRNNPPSTFPTDFYVKQSDVDSMGMFGLRVTSPNWEWRLNVTIFGGTDGEYRIEGNDRYQGRIEAVNIGGIDYIHLSCPDFPNDSIDVESIDWWNEPMDYYGNSTVLPIQYDKSIFNDYMLYQGYPYNTLDDIEHIGKGVIYNIDGYLYKDKERTTTNPYNLGDTYGKYKTLSGTSITEIKLLDENIDVIGNYAFFNCSGITSVTIGDSVTSIGGDAFNSCYSLTSIEIPNSVTSIGGDAFDTCTSLTSVTIGNSVTNIGNNAFLGCTSLTSVTIGNSVTSIGESAFYGCSGLTSIELPNSVTVINNRTFFGCTNLAEIHFKGMNAPTYSGTSNYGHPFGNARISSYSGRTNYCGANVATPKIYYPKGGKNYNSNTVGYSWLYIATVGRTANATYYYGDTTSKTVSVKGYGWQLVEEGDPTTPTEPTPTASTYTYDDIIQTELDPNI